MRVRTKLILLAVAALAATMAVWSVLARNADDSADRCLTLVAAGPANHPLAPTEPGGMFCVTKGRHRGRDLTFDETKALLGPPLIPTPYGDTVHLHDTFDEAKAWLKRNGPAMAARRPLDSAR